MNQPYPPVAFQQAPPPVPPVDGHIPAYLSDPTRDARHAAARRDMLLGGLLALIGIGVTVFTYTQASSSASGGHYVVAYGPAVAGIVIFFRGLTSYRKP